MDLHSMTNAELEELDSRLRGEQQIRRCPEFLPGQPSCDMGSKPPHDEHGFTTFRGDQKIRVTWKIIDGPGCTPLQVSAPIAGRSLEELVEDKEDQDDEGGMA